MPLFTQLPTRRVLGTPDCPGPLRIGLVLVGFYPSSTGARHPCMMDVPSVLGPEIALHLPVNFLRPLFSCSQVREVGRTGNLH